MEKIVSGGSLLVAEILTQTFSTSEPNLLWSAVTLVVALPLLRHVADTVYERMTT